MSHTRWQLFEERLRLALWRLRHRHDWTRVVPDTDLWWCEGCHQLSRDGKHVHIRA